MKYALLVVALLTCGCTVPASLTGSPAGTYSGTVTCETSLIVNGNADATQDPRTITVILDAAGLPLIDGTAIAMGMQTDDTFGALSSMGTVVSVTNNGMVQVEVEGPTSFCAVGCALSGNGTCNEPTDCVLGTDCDDCGAYTLDGTASFTYEVVGDTLGYTAKVIGGSDTDMVTFRVDCDGTLTR